MIENKPMNTEFTEEQLQRNLIDVLLGAIVDETTDDDNDWSIVINRLIDQYPAQKDYIACWRAQYEIPSVENIDW